jgi:hypothetical protein
MKKDDVVKFVKESELEKEYRESGRIIMKIVWVDAPRCMVVADVGHMVNPTSIHNVDELELVK